MEQELVGAAKRIIHPGDKKSISWQVKLLRVAGEILIIVFAISFSLVLERWRENSHDRHVEKLFLSDLRNDLTNKIIEFREDSSNYDFIFRSWKYLNKVSEGEVQPQADSVMRAASSINMVLLLNSNNSLFESVKSGGKLYIIEDKKLLEKIVSLYQQDIPALIKSIELFYYPTTRELDNLMSANYAQTKNPDGLITLLKTTPAFQYRLSKYYQISIIKSLYGRAISQSEDIIRMIGKDQNK